MSFNINSKNLTVTHLKDDLYDVPNLFKIPLGLTSIAQEHWKTLSKYSEFQDEKNRNYRLISVNHNENTLLLERID